MKIRIGVSTGRGTPDAASLGELADDIEEREANLKHALNLAEAADRAKPAEPKTKSKKKKTV